MTSNPLVSVVIIFLNEEKFLRQAIDSVLAQTYTNWELLIVDDGSTDKSTHIAKEYAAGDTSRIRYLEHPGHANCGTSASRNLGIRNARGEYIALLDSDDVWLPHKLSQQVAGLEAHREAVMIFGDPLYWRSWTNNPQDVEGDSVRGIWTAPNAVVHPPQMLKVSHPLGKGGAPCPSDLLLRRDFVQRVGGFEEDFVGIYQLFEDQAFLAKVYLSGAILVSNECWTMYRIHPDSCVATVKRDGHFHHVRLFYLRWLRRYLRSAGVRDPEIHTALSKAFRAYDPSLVSWLYRQARRAMRYVSASSSPV
jgi:glycosyltransferase involved in cell wall biosynthesis